jgi:hypothetical protein
MGTIVDGAAASFWNQYIIFYWSALADAFRTFMLNRDIFELALSTA